MSRDWKHLPIPQVAFQLLQRCHDGKSLLLWSANRASLIPVFDTAGYGRIRQDTAGYVRIRQDTAGYGRIGHNKAEYGMIRQDTARYGSIRQHTGRKPGYGRIRQDTTGYGTIQTICLFALCKQPFCVHSGFGGISYSSWVPIVTFVFRSTTRFAVHQFSVWKRKRLLHAYRFWWYFILFLRAYRLVFV